MENELDPFGENMDIKSNESKEKIENERVKIKEWNKIITHLRSFDRNIYPRLERI